MTLSAECFVAGSAECFVTGGAECLVTGAAECFVTGGADFFMGTDFLAVHSACFHPNLPCVPLYSYKWGNMVPMNIVLQLVWA